MLIINTQIPTDDFKLDFVLLANVNAVVEAFCVEKMAF